MADDLTLPATGGVVATDDVGGKHYQRIKVDVGADGAASPLVRGGQSRENSLPAGLSTEDEALLQAIIDAITGNVNDGAADSGASSKTAGVGRAGLSSVTLESAGDRVPNPVGLDGAQYVREIPLEDLVDGTASNTDGTSTQAIAAAGSGVKIYLTKASFSNTHASTSVMVALKSGTTSRWRVNVPPGGREVNFADGHLKPNAANEAWNFDPDSAVTTIECSLLGYKSKV